MHNLAPLIYDLAVMLGVAGIVILLFQRIHQPVVLGYLVAGMILGPYTPPHQLITDEPNIKILSELGVIFLMFSLGLEFTFHKLTRVGLSALVTGLVDVSFMLGVGLAAGYFLGWSRNDTIFLAAALSISSTTIIIKAIDELGLKTKRFAEFIFGVLIVEDLLAILLLVGLSTLMVKHEWLSMDMLSTFLRLVMVVGAWFLAGYFILPSLFKRIAKYLSQETLTIASVALCLFLVTMADRLNYSTALGAFIMGSILAETVLVNRIEAAIIPIRDIFGAVFFISVGMLIDPHVIVSEWRAVLLIAGFLILGKVTVIGVMSFLTGQSVNTSVRSAFGMAQIGEFSFIIATLGLTLNVINDKLYPIVVAVSGITTFTTPYFIVGSARICNAIENALPPRAKFFLDAYTARLYRMTSGSSENAWIRSIFMRTLMNGMVVAIFFTLIDQYLFNEILLFVDKKTYAKILAELISVVCATPFIWGMLFSYRRVHVPHEDLAQLKSVKFFVWLLTLIEICILSLVYYHTWATGIMFGVITILFFVSSFKQLEKSYHWFETQLVGNIKKKPSKHTRYQELAPWDTHFIELTAGNRSALLKKTLNELQLRQIYGINIVAIYRGHQIVISPTKNEMLYAGDRLIVLGNDEQIELFTKKISVCTIEEDSEMENPLEEFRLKPIYMDRHPSMVGASIRASGIVAKYQGLVVGLERGEERVLNPDLDVELKAGDILYVVTERKLKPVGV